MNVYVTERAQLLPGSEKQNNAQVPIHNNATPKPFDYKTDK
jgi:hypothetical protein